MAAPQTAPSSPKGNALTRKIGPLPAWQWGAIAIVGVGGIYYIIKKRQAAATSTTPPSSITPVGAVGIDPTTGLPISPDGTIQDGSGLPNGPDTQAILDQLQTDEAEDTAEDTTGTGDTDTDTDTDTDSGAGGGGAKKPPPKKAPPKKKPVKKAPTVKRKPPNTGTKKPARQTPVGTRGPGDIPKKSPFAPPKKAKKVTKAKLNVGTLRGGSPS